MGIVALLILAVISSSCEHKDLCYDHVDHELKYHTKIVGAYNQDWHHKHGEGPDWESEWPDYFGFKYDDLRPIIPEGLRVLVYEDKTNVNTVNLPAEGGILRTKEGEHSLLFYNNNTEQIVFHGLDSYPVARATTRTLTRSTYMGNPYVDTKTETTVNPPDVLYGSYIDTYAPPKVLDPEELTVTMHSLVFSYVVRYEFAHGLKYVSLARGALAGMAAEVYLHTGETSEDVATLLFDCTKEDFGVQCVVNSFGVPGFPRDNYTKAPRQYGLNLEVKLRNGKIINFDFDVSDQLANQPHGGVIIVKDIVIDDETGEGGSSGFDPDVDDWGDYTDIVLPL